MQAMAEGFALLQGTQKQPPVLVRLKFGSEAIGNQLKEETVSRSKAIEVRLAWGACYDGPSQRRHYSRDASGRRGE